MIFVKEKKNNKIIGDSERQILQRRNQNLFENMIQREQNHILSIYNNPLFFGVGVLFQSFLNKNDDIEGKNNNKELELENKVEQ